MNGNHQGNSKPGRWHSRAGKLVSMAIGWMGRSKPVADDEKVTAWLKQVPNDTEMNDSASSASSPAPSIIVPDLFSSICDTGLQPCESIASESTLPDSASHSNGKVSHASNKDIDTDDSEAVSYSRPTNGAKYVEISHQNFVRPGLSRINSETQISMRSNGHDSELESSGLIRREISDSRRTAQDIPTESSCDVTGDKRLEISRQKSKYHGLSMENATPQDICHKEKESGARRKLQFSTICISGPGLKEKPTSTKNMDCSENFDDQNINCNPACDSFVDDSHEDDSNSPDQIYSQTASRAIGKSTVNGPHKGSHGIGVNHKRQGKSKENNGAKNKRTCVVQKSSRMALHPIQDEVLTTKSNTELEENNLGDVCHQTNQSSANSILEPSLEQLNSSILNRTADFVSEHLGNFEYDLFESDIHESNNMSSPKSSDQIQGRSRSPQVQMETQGDDDLLPEFYLDNSADIDSPDKTQAVASPSLVIHSSQPQAAAPSNFSMAQVSGSPSTSATQSSSQKRKTSPRENTRKRNRNSWNWRVKKAKEGFNLGVEHLTSRKKVRKAREMGPGCKSTCRKCKRRLNLDEREAIFQVFWKKLRNVHEKRSYISHRISCTPPMTCFTTEERAKKFVRSYSLTVGKERVKVCKTMFLDTLGVADCWVETSLKKSKNGMDVMSPDKRGKHLNRPNRSDPRTIELVRKHINLFPRVPSHYTREKTRREYLEPEVKSVNKMHKLYCKWADTVHIVKKASISLYRKIFNTQFNLGFFLPKKDQCEVCNRWKNAKNQEERRSMIQEYSLHLANKKVVYKMKKADKASASERKCVACFDLQKVLNCPQSQTSYCFYRNKLSLYNFTVFDLRLKEGHCYMWTEVDAHRGSNEIGTNLFKFIELKVAEGCEEFGLWSDGPLGQNKNRMIFSMWLLAAAKFKIKITHRFLESGHSYSEADSIHATIEREAHLKEIITPEEWESVILNAKQDDKPYVIHHLKNEDVLDLHYLVDRQNWEVNTEKCKVLWSQVREIVVDHKIPNTVFYRYSFSEPSKKVVVTLKKGQQLNMANYEPPQAYNGRFALDDKKAKDLKFLCEKKAIPSRYHDAFGLYLSV